MCLEVNESLKLLRDFFKALRCPQSQRTLNLALALFKNLARISPIKQHWKGNTAGKSI